MIVAKITGGLGNQLFQYAFARHLSLIHNTELRLDISSYNEYKPHNYGLSNFNILENFFPHNENLDLIPIKEKHFHFDPDFISLPNNIYIQGYWQSEKYFNQISSVIKKDLQLKYPMGSKDKKFYELISKANSVSLHIRRGDYIPGTYDDQVSECLTLDYYEKTIHQIQQKNPDVVFFVFSDDITWAKENLSISRPAYYVDHNSTDANFQDLRLMSLCKHNIIANSSFSWWGAWLNSNLKKEVYAPINWFNSNARNLNSQDIVPNEWVRI
jgi:hypothetical protein